MNLPSALDETGFILRVLMGRVTPHDLLSLRAAVLMELLAPELDVLDAQGRKNLVERYKFGQYTIDDTKAKTLPPIQPGPGQLPDGQPPESADGIHAGENSNQNTPSPPQTPPNAGPSAPTGRPQADTAAGAFVYRQAGVNALADSKPAMDPLPLERNQNPDAVVQRTSPYGQGQPGTAIHSNQPKMPPYNPLQTQSPAGGHAVQHMNQSAGGQAVSVSAGQQIVYGDGPAGQNKDWWETHPDPVGGSLKQPAQSQVQAPKTAAGAQEAPASAGQQRTHDDGLVDQNKAWREARPDAAGRSSKQPAQSQAQAPKIAGSAARPQSKTLDAQQSAAPTGGTQSAASPAEPQTAQSKHRINLGKPDIPSHKASTGTVHPDKQMPPAPGPEALDRTAGARSAIEPPEGNARPKAAEPPPAPAPLADDTVTAHSAAQWKYKEVPPGTPDTYDQYLTDHKEYPLSTVDGARVRGKKHKHEGTNADDWFEVADVDGITILAVSDGAGSRKLSRIGARTACEASVAFIREQLQDIKKDPAAWEALYAKMTAAEGSPEMQQGIKQMGGIINKAMLQAIAAVHSAHEQRRDKPEFEDLLGRKPEFQDFAATMLLAIIVPLRGREKFIVTCQVGDGMITALDLKDPFNAQTTARLLGRPDSGEYSGQTEFITSSSAADEKQLRGKTMICRRPVDLVLAMTDGVADDYYPNQTQMPRLYYDLLANGILEEQHAPAAKLPEGIKLPEPVSYPWVNNPDVMVTLQYANRLLEESGKTIADVWEDRAAIFGAASKTLPKSIGSGVSEKLCTWLDNYVQRGSFDDRTLVIAQLKEADA